MKIDKVCETVQEKMMVLGRYKSDYVLRAGILIALNLILMVLLFDNKKSMLIMIALTFIIEFYFWDAITIQYWNHAAIIFNRVFIPNADASVRWVSYLIHYSFFLLAYLFVLFNKVFAEV